MLVVGLPAVEAAQLPPLRAVNKAEVFCLEKSPLVLPVEGAPLVFATDIAHDFVLACREQNPEPASTFPLWRIAARGGFSLIRRGCMQASSIRKRRELFAGAGDSRLSTDRFPTAGPRMWRSGSIPAPDQSSLIVGRDDLVHLQSASAACVEKVSMRLPSTAKI